MAMKKSSSRKADEREVARNKEEDQVLQMYRNLSRWEKNCLHVLMCSLAWGEMIPETTDRYSWKQVWAMHGVGPDKDSARAQS